MTETCSARKLLTPIFSPLSSSHLPQTGEIFGPFETAKKKKKNLHLSCHHSDCFIPSPNFIIREHAGRKIQKYVITAGVFEEGVKCLIRQNKAVKNVHHPLAVEKPKLAEVIVGREM